MANGYMKRCPVSLIIGKCKSKIRRQHLISFKMTVTKTQKITSIGEDVGKRERSWTVDKKVNRYSNYGKQSGGSSENQTYHVTQQAPFWVYRQRLKPEPQRFYPLGFTFSLAHNSRPINQLKVHQRMNLVYL